jgi:hypothetical protein
LFQWSNGNIVMSNLFSFLNEVFIAKF